MLISMKLSPMIPGGAVRCVTKPSAWFQWSWVSGTRGRCPICHPFRDFRVSFTWMFCLNPTAFLFPLCPLSSPLPPFFLFTVMFRPPLSGSDPFFESLGHQINWLTFVGKKIIIYGAFLENFYGSSFLKNVLKFFLL